MNATDLCFASATDLAAAIRAKKISPVEVVEAFLNRIDRLNPKINAYCLLLHDRAREGAKKAEAAVMRGETLGPLHGVPIAIKDLTPTAGITTTFGSKAFAHYVPAEDAVFVERIKAAGAIMLGKTNTPELGHKGTTDNPLFGITRNPWNLNCMAGGSSGGSAAAVVAGLAPFAEGSDGGGSIRIPASACGVYGLKPQFGRVPMDILTCRYNQLLHFGPMTRTVADAALLLSVMAGPDDRDPLSLPASGEDYTQCLSGGVKDWRVAYSPDLGFYKVDSRVRRVVDAAVKIFADLGCEVEVVNPGFENPEETIQQAFIIQWQALNAALFQDLLPQWREQMTPTAVSTIEGGQRYSAVDYVRAEQHRTNLWHKIRAIFANHHILLAPTLAVPPFSVDLFGPTEVEGQPIHPWIGWLMTYPFNLTGQPAASIPAGFTEEGLPVGLQIVGPRYGEGVVLRASAAFEEATPWADKRPPLE